MRAYQVHNFGEKPVLLDRSPEKITHGQVRVQIAACALNFADLLMIRGKYQDMPPLPFIPGLELCGRICEVGAGVADLALGDRVAIFAGSGGFATEGVFPADRCIKVPHSLSDAEAAGVLVAYGTSHLALMDRAGLQQGDTVIVTGAAGGVGLTAVEIAAAKGARVVAIARGPEKLDTAKAAGAQIAISSEDPDLTAKLKDLGGAQIVYDAVGGDLFKPCLRACAPEARYLAIGFASGDVPQIPANILLVKNLTVQGFYWGGVLKYAPAKVMDSLADVFAMMDAGQLRPDVRHTFPFENALDALDFLEQRKSTGKVVITMGD